MRLRPFFKYPGSKHTLAKRYPRPRYDVVVEPFAGSAQYSTLHYERQVLLIESDPEIAQLWHWLVTVDPDVVARLPVDLPHGEDIRTLGLPSRGAELLVRAWQRVGSNNCWTVSKWCGLNSGMWSARTRDAIASQVEKIRHWKVLHLKFDPSLAGVPAENATYFIDAPYQSIPDIYRSEPLDYRALASYCKRLKGQVIVCEAGGAKWLPFRFLAVARAGRTKQGGTRNLSVELLWMNDERFFATS